MGSIYLSAPRHIIVVFVFMFFCLLKFYVFDKMRDKYAEVDFVKFIPFEINYFEGTYFCF